MRPGHAATQELVLIDDVAVDGWAADSQPGGGTSSVLRRAHDRLRPLLRVVDAGRCRPGGGHDRGGEPVVNLPLLTLLWAVPMLGAVRSS